MTHFLLRLLPDTQGWRLEAPKQRLGADFLAQGSLPAAGDITAQGQVT